MCQAPECTQVATSSLQDNVCQTSMNEGKGQSVHTDGKTDVDDAPTDDHRSFNDLRYKKDGRKGDHSLGIMGTRKGENGN